MAYTQAVTQLGSFVVVVVAFLLGAIPTGILLTRRAGVDIRTVGSGNSGATNIQRNLGWRLGLAAGLLDLAKGALSVIIARDLHAPEGVIALCLFAVTLGNTFNPFLRLKGGKGVATGFGALLALDPLAALPCFVFGVVTVTLTRYVSAGSLIGVLAALTAILLLRRPWPEALAMLLVTLLIWWQHRQNIARLQAGTESRFGEKKPVRVLN